MPAHKPGESIEGLRVHGHSRDPLRIQRTTKVDGIKYFIYKAEFNVFAEVIIGLTSGIQKIGENSSIIEGETIGCDTALITTKASTRTPPRQGNLSEKTVSNVSHTHGASKWEFNKQTNVKVVTPRQEIINALQKRENNNPDNVLKTTLISTL